MQRLTHPLHRCRARRVVAHNDAPQPVARVFYDLADAEGDRWRLGCVVFTREGVEPRGGLQAQDPRANP